MKQYKITLNDKEYKAVVDSTEDELYTVEVDGVKYEVKVEDTTPTEDSSVKSTPKPKVQKEQKEVQVANTGAQWHATTPLPGTIIEIAVSVGDKVRKGQTVAILEAMKMENHIESEVDGIVTEILVNQGDAVLEGVKIVTLTL